MCVKVSALYRVCWKDPNLVIITPCLSWVFALISTKSSGSCLTRVSSNVKHSSISRSFLLQTSKFCPEMERECIALAVVYVCLYCFGLLQFGSKMELYTDPKELRRMIYIKSLWVQCTEWTVQALQEANENPVYKSPWRPAHSLASTDSFLCSWYHFSPHHNGHVLGQNNPFPWLLLTLLHRKENKQHWHVSQTKPHVIYALGKQNF